MPHDWEPKPRIAKRHGLFQINPDKGNGEVAPEVKELMERSSDLEEVSGLDVPELAGWTVKPRYKVSDKVGDKPGPFDGWYVAEEYHGMDHPLLLVPPNKVEKQK